MLFLSLFVTNTPPERIIGEDIGVVREGSSHTPERFAASSSLSRSLSRSLPASRPTPPHHHRVESGVRRGVRGTGQSARVGVGGIGALHALHDQVACLLHAARERLSLLLKNLKLVAEEKLLTAKLERERERERDTCSRWLLWDRFSL